LCCGVGCVVLWFWWVCWCVLVCVVVVFCVICWCWCLGRRG
jgi:hypothetical protein